MFFSPHLSESSWEKPADLPSNEASVSNKEEENQEEEEESQEEPPAPQPEPLSGEESSNGASQEAQAPEQTSQQPKVPKIYFRVSRVLELNEKCERKKIRETW